MSCSETEDAKSKMPSCPACQAQGEPRRMIKCDKGVSLEMQRCRKAGFDLHINERFYESSFHRAAEEKLANSDARSPVY